MVSTFSSTLEGPDVQPGRTEDSRLPAACDQPFLSLGRAVGAGALWGFRGDFARGVPPALRAGLTLLEGLAARACEQGTGKLLGSGGLGEGWPAAAWGFGLSREFGKKIIDETGLQAR